MALAFHNEFSAAALERAAILAGEAPASAFDDERAESAAVAAPVAWIWRLTALGLAVGVFALAVLTIS